MHKLHMLKEITRRGTMLVAAAGLLGGVGSTMIPALASADALNPLTERSLTLSSSSPGWSYTDGSNNDTYAKPNMGANGKKTGNTFTFVTSTTGTIKAFSFQYCTAPAGNCQAPGDDNLASTPGTDDAGHSDFNVVVAGGDNKGTIPSEVSSSDWTTLNGRTGDMAGIPNPDGTEGDFVVLTGTSFSNSDLSISSGWNLYTTNKEEAGTTTGKNNQIIITNSTGQSIPAGTHVKIVFFGTNDNYITNPGSGAFFAKINDYSAIATAGTQIDQTDPLNPTPATPPVLDSADIVDGGVTVANVMNESIAISTKVLETMDFSVGTVDPDTLSNTDLATVTDGSKSSHGQCDPVLPNITSVKNDPHNILKMGNSDAEYSLSTSTSYATHSYFRLSSNSSGGATVYYAGVTLSNTEGDQIDPIGNTAAAPNTGTEQFGIALDNGSGPNYGVNYSIPGSGTAPNIIGDGTEYGVDNTDVLANENDASNTNTNKGLSKDWDASSFADGHDPKLAPLVPESAYGGGTGAINGSTGTSFAFSPTANTIPEPLASESDQVVNCVTGKVRYIGNIAATTPAGIYTTKINYIASPQY